MTIPDDVKQPLLRSFHEKTVTPGWNFNGNGPNEKDRIVLVDYHVVVDELLRLDPMYAHLSYLERRLISPIAAVTRSSTYAAKWKREWPTLHIALRFPQSR
jgi:hypothetical protein